MVDLENYTVIRNLGSGAFGQVKCNHHLVACHNLTKVQVAIKIIQKDLAKEQGLLKGIRNEARFLRRFDHQYIIKLYKLSRFEYINKETVIYLVLEYVPGGELYSLLEKKGKLPEHEAKKMFYQLVMAVQYSHSQGVAHRDIKPENILLDESKNIKLGDFGLSNQMKDGEFMKTACGSANYAAPEIVSGQKYCGAEADIWSLGVLLFLLLSGYLPFDEASMPALIQKIKSAKFTFPYHISENAADLIEKMLVANPLYRIFIADILKHPWIAYSYPAPPITTPVPVTIDEEVFSNTQSFFLYLNDREQEIKKEKILKKKGNDIFIVSYEMLLYKKQKTLGIVPFNFKRVFKPVKIFTNAGKTPNDWRFCFCFDNKSDVIMITLCEKLKDIGAYWRFETPFFMSIVVKDHDKILKVEARLYEAKTPQEGKKFFVDLRRIKGHYLRFLDWCMHMYKIVQFCPTLRIYF